MRTSKFITPLAVGDLRSKGKSDSVVLKIQRREDFDELFQCLFHEDRKVVMRAADVIEKFTIKDYRYLAKHKQEILELSETVRNKELKWHLALLLPRLKLSDRELGVVWNMLTAWAKDKTNSRIVRVNSIQGLFDLLKHKKDLQQDFDQTLLKLDEEEIPSIKARIRILKALKQKEKANGLTSGYSVRVY